MKNRKNDFTKINEYLHSNLNKELKNNLLYEMSISVIRFVLYFLKNIPKIF